MASTIIDAIINVHINAIKYIELYENELTKLEMHFQYQ